MKYEDGALLERQAPERSVELIAVMDRANGVLGGRVHGRQEADVCRPAPATPRLGIALVSQDSMQPRLEAVDVAQRPQLTPGSDERGLHGVFGQIEVAEDPRGDGHAAVPHTTRQRACILALDPSASRAVNFAGNTSVNQGDTWLSNTVSSILGSQAYSNNGAIFVVWDEGTGGSDGPIGMIAISPFARGGDRLTEHRDSPLLISC